MDRKKFEDLIESAHEALAHAQGRRDLRTTVLPPRPKGMRPTDVRRLRRRLNASQAVFAGYLNVSVKLVQAWEAGRRSPEGAALRLLRLAEQAPELLLTRIASASGSPKALRRSAPRSAALQARKSRPRRPTD